MNSNNWPGSNAAGMGRTAFPVVADDGTGLKGTLFGGEATLGKNYAATGPSANGASPTDSTTAAQPLTGQTT